MDLDLSAAEAVVVFSAIACGAFLQGYTGFGAGLVWVSGLVLVLEPDEAVAAVALLGTLGAIRLLPSWRRDVQWSMVGLLTVGAVVGTPIGVAVLASLDPEPMQVVVSTVVLAAVVVLAMGLRFRRPPGPPGTIATGVVSGVLKGATSAGGPPVIAFTLARPEGIAAARASMIVYFGIIDVLAAASLAGAGLIDRTSITRTLLGIPALLLGTTLGGRTFRAAEPETVRRAAMVALAVLATVGVVQAVV